MARCVIIGGAEIRNYPAVSAFLKEDDFNIFCDCGLAHEKPLGIVPGLIVGDFDSYTRPETAVETIVLPTVKDDTDTYYALREGLKRGYDEFVFVGVVGGRFDHTLGNLSMLLWLDTLGKRGTIIDDYSEMEIVSSYAEIADSYPFFSLLMVDGAAKGITIENAKYLLRDAEITPDYQYGVSNEPLPGGARVSVKDGRMLLIKDRV